jgi:hypothetical protein
VYARAFQRSPNPLTQLAKSVAHARMGSCSVTTHGDACSWPDKAFARLCPRLEIPKVRHPFNARRGDWRAADRPAFICQGLKVDVGASLDHTGLLNLPLAISVHCLDVIS